MLFFDLLYHSDPYFIHPPFVYFANPQKALELIREDANLTPHPSTGDMRQMLDDLELNAPGRN
jgi:hypothetical protein